MGALSKRVTIYLDPALHKALRLKSEETSRSVSDVVNDAVRHAMAEDAEDLAAFEQRAREPNQPLPAQARPSLTAKTRNRERRSQDSPAAVPFSRFRAFAVKRLFLAQCGKYRLDDLLKGVTKRNLHHEHFR